MNSSDQGNTQGGVAASNQGSDVSANQQNAVWSDAEQGFDSGIDGYGEVRRRDSAVHRQGGEQDRGSRQGGNN